MSDFLKQLLLSAITGAFLAFVAVPEYLEQEEDETVFFQQEALVLEALWELDQLRYGVRND